MNSRGGCWQLAFRYYEQHYSCARCIRNILEQTSFGGRMMRQIADSVGAVIVPVHHYGKDPNTGLRGASAWRAAADVVLSVTCDVDALSGRATDHCLAISKARDAEQGPIAPFILEQVPAIDEDGEPLNTCVVRYNPLGLVRRPRANVPKGIRTLDDACRIALGKRAQDVQLRKGDGTIRAVGLECVKHEFLSLYVTGQTELKKATAARERAWQRALDELPDQYAIGRAENGYEWIWLKIPNSGLPRRLAGNANWTAWKAILLVRVFAILTSIDFATSCCGFVPRSRRFQKRQEPSSHAKRFPSGNEWR